MSGLAFNAHGNSEKPRLVVLSHVNPLFRLSGQQQRVYYTLVALREHFHLTFVGFAEAGKLERIRSGLLPLCDSVELLPSIYARSVFSKIWHRCLGWLYQRRSGLKFSNYLIGHVEFSPKRLASMLAGRKFDLALVEYLYASESMAWFQANNIPCVLDMHNILWRSYARQLDARGISGEQKTRAISRYRAAEEKAWSRFDALIAISVGERDYVRARISGDKHLFYAPMGIPLEHWPYSWRREQPSRIAYYGGLGSAHNASDARRCIEKIMPSIWRKLADAELWIIGGNPPPELFRLAERDPRIKVTGFVEKVQEALKTISVLLCPFSGTYGFRSRVIEAMALGVPVVATPDAVHGMDLDEQRGIFLAPTDEAMASQALRLLTDASLAAEQSREARRQVEEKYSFESSYGRLAEELAAFAEQGRQSISR